VPRCLDRENDAFILVVDDVVMAVVRLVICKLLRRAGHTVEEANHALARVAIRAPDAVVTDLWMPESDGLSLIRASQAGYPAVAVVAMTGGSSRQQDSLIMLVIAACPGWGAPGLVSHLEALLAHRAGVATRLRMTTAPDPVRADFDRLRIALPSLRIRSFMEIDRRAPVGGKRSDSVSKASPQEMALSSDERTDRNLVALPSEPEFRNQHLERPKSSSVATRTCGCQCWRCESEVAPQKRRGRPTQSGFRMNQTTPQLQSLATRLIAQEASRKSAGIHVLATFHVSEKLAPHVANLMGKGGYRALLGRALALASAEVPWLNAVKVNADGTLEGFQALHMQADPADFLEGKVVVLAHLIELLVALIGSDLTATLVADIRPKLGSNNIAFGR
jgi:CheY-like chemotaxis protein